MNIHFLFWIAFLFIFYTYVGYPLLLYCWVIIFPKYINKKETDNIPSVSVLIAVKNEENHIQRRLDNLINQIYPPEKLEIIIVSDGSTDKTNKLVQSKIEKYTKPPYIKFISLPESKGKPNALNEGVAYATGDIIVFTDARQQFAPDAIKELVTNFSEPEVGCVSGELYFSNTSESSIKDEMGLYWTIEKKIRKLESSIGSVVGATGAIYAIRKSLFVKLPPETLIDDVLIPMSIVMNGHRTIFDSNAHAYDTFSPDSQIEWNRKVRTLAGNWQLLNLKPTLFSPFSNPIWWRFLSHKFFRLLVPFVLPFAMVIGYMMDNTFANIFSICMTIFLLLAITGSLIPKSRSIRIINYCYFFFMILNLATICGFWHWLSGNSQSVWKKEPNK